MSLPPRSPDKTASESVAVVRLLDALQIALQRGERGRAVELIGQLIARRAPMGEQWRQLASIAADFGEATLARSAIALFVEGFGGAPLARYHEFDLLSRLGALREAQAVLATLPESVPDPAVNAYSRGVVTAFLGELGQARGELERATHLRPAMGQVWLSLSTLVDFAKEAGLAARLFAAEDAVASAPAPLRAAYYYAVGKARRDRNEHAAAFAAFARGAELKRSLVKYDREADRTNAAEAVRGYTPEAIAALACESGESTARSIFVTGLPRSGTTLVERIITSHSSVSGGAEINLVRVLLRDVGGLACPTLERYVAEHGADAAARLWNHLLQERFPAPGRVVDKSVDAQSFLGVIAALLPEAPLIWLTRDPLDCAWSCFRTHFFSGLEWTTDLEDIAFHFRLHDALLAQWRELLGERLLVVPMEALIAEPNVWIRRILVHCGLTEEAAMFAPHENRRPVTSSSLLQVRRPINRAGIGSAMPYRSYLAPFIDAYYA